MATPKIEETKKENSMIKARIRFSSANACFVADKKSEQSQLSDRYKMSRISEDSHMSNSSRNVKRSTRAKRNINEKLQNAAE